MSINSYFNTLACTTEKVNNVTDFSIKCSLHFFFLCSFLLTLLCARTAVLLIESSCGSTPDETKVSPSGIQALPLPSALIIIINNVHLVPLGVLRDNKSLSRGPMDTNT